MQARLFAVGPIYVFNIADPTHSIQFSNLPVQRVRVFTAWLAPTASAKRVAADVALPNFQPFVGALGAARAVRIRCGGLLRSAGIRTVSTSIHPGRATRNFGIDAGGRWG